MTTMGSSWRADAPSGFNHSPISTSVIDSPTAGTVRATAMKSSVKVEKRSQSAVVVRDDDYSWIPSRDWPRPVEKSERTADDRKAGLRSGDGDNARHPNF